MIIGPWDDVAVVPAVVGLTVRDAIDYAGWAKVGIGRSPDGPPLESLVYPCDEFVVTSQTPPPGTRLRRYETVIVEMVSYRLGRGWSTRTAASIPANSQPTSS